MLLPGLVAVLAYLVTLRFAFVWDDATFLVDLPLYRDPARGWRAVLAPFPISPGYFRPLPVLTFMLEIRLAGLDPTLPHATNVLLHALDAILVTALAGGALAPGASRWRAVALGLGYALHPALVEGVAFVSSRFDLLFTAWALLALLADHRLARHPLRPLAVAGCFLASALAKEMAVTLPLVLVLWRAARAPVPATAPAPSAAAAVRAALRRALADRPARLTDAAVLAAGVLYLGLRVAGLGYLVRPGGAHLPQGEPLQHGLLVARSLAEYARLVVWPFTSLTPIHYAALPVPARDPAAWSAVALGALALVALGATIRRAPATGWPLAAVLVALAPVVNLVPLDLTGGAFVAERFLVFPLALLALAGATLPPLPAPGRPGPRAAVMRRGLPALGVAWLVASAVTVAVTLPHWRSNGTLWRWAVDRAPRSATAHVNLSLEQSREGDPLLALATAQRAVELDPRAAMGWNNAGLALFHLRRHDEARTHFAEAARLEPGNALFWNNLAAVLMEEGDLAEAERVLREEALRRHPDQPLAHLNLGALHLRRERPDLAIPALERALVLLAPAERPKAQALLASARDPGRWLRLGDVLLGRGDARGALRAFEEAGRLGGRAADVAVGRSASLLQAGDAVAALTAAEEGLRAAPDDARLHVNAGVAARRQGDLPRARGHFERAMALAPDWELPRRNLQGLPR